MMKDVKVSCNFHAFFIFKTHADTPLIEFKKPHFVEKRKNLTFLRFNEKSPFLH